MKPAISKNFDETYTIIRDVLERARSAAYRAVNFEMVHAYWSIGRIIVEDEQRGEERAEYGRALIKELSLRLTEDYGRGFDESNLRNIRKFYLTFPNGDALRHELSWTHYCLFKKITSAIDGAKKLKELQGKLKELMDAK